MVYSLWSFFLLVMVLVVFGLGGLVWLSSCSQYALWCLVVGFARLALKLVNLFISYWVFGGYLVSLLSQ